jgi:hypothetical protein
MRIAASAVALVSVVAASAATGAFGELLGEANSGWSSRGVLHRWKAAPIWSSMRAGLLTSGLRRAATAPAMARVLSTKVTSGATGVYPAAPSPLQEFSVVYTDRALNHM